MHLPNCHLHHRALGLDEPRYSRAISGWSLVHWLIPRGKALQLLFPLHSTSLQRALRPLFTLASAFPLVISLCFDTMRQLAAETRFPDLSAFGGLWAKQTPDIGALWGLGVRDPRTRIGIVIYPLFLFWCAGPPV